MSHIQNLAGIVFMAFPPTTSDYIKEGPLRAAMEGITRHDPSVETTEDLRACTGHYIKEAFSVRVCGGRGHVAADDANKFASEFWQMVDETYHGDILAVVSDRRRLKSLFMGHLNEMEA